MSRYILFVIAACGSSSPSSPDAPTPDAAAPDSAGVCSSVTEVGGLVPQTRVASALPTASGGTIPDGRYALTHWFVYTGPGGASGATGLMESQTTVVTGTHAHTAGKTTSNVEVLDTFTLAINGTALVVTQICPTPNPPSSATLPWNRFSQNGNVVTLYASSTGEALEYTLMP